MRRPARSARSRRPTSSTIPSPIIAIGIRATNAAEENRRPPGVREQLAVGPQHARTLRDRADGRVAGSGLRGSAGEHLAVRRVPAGVLRRARRGRTTCCRSWRTSPAAAAIPRERLLEVAEHYLGFGGVSPINAQNRALVAAIEADFAAHGLDLPVYWGNRNWAPVPHRGAGPDRAPTGTAGCWRCSRRRTRRTPAAASTARTSPRAVEPLGDRAPAGRPDPALLQPPGLRRGDGGEHRWPRSTRCPPRCATAPGWSSSTHSVPTTDGRGQRPRRRRLHRPAPGRGPAGHGRGRRGDRHRPRARPRLLQPQRAADPAVARAGRQRPPRGAGRRRRPGGRAGADRVRVRPHGGQVRPRHRGAGDRATARAAGRPGGDGGHRPEVRRGGARAGARAGRRRPGRGAGTPVARRAGCEPRRVPRRLLPQRPRPAAPGPVRA